MNKVLVIAESHQEHLSSSTLSTLTAAQQLASGYDVFIASDQDTLAEKLLAYEGVNNVWVLKHKSLSHIIADDLAPVLAEMGKSYTHLLAPATTFGKNLMPRVAALLNVAQISDLVEIGDEQTFVRPIYAGNALEKIRSKDSIKVMTIRTTAFNPASTQTSSNGQIREVTLPYTPSEKVVFKSESVPESTRPELTTAKIIVSGGRGFKSAEHFKMIYRLADILHAAVGASRAAVDAGFVLNDYQVGQTGKVVAPDLYIAIGISGAIQHLAGMKESKIIVAINQDPDAPICQIADYTLVGDLFKILPEMEAAL